MYTPRVHFVGIGGAGMSALARLLLEAGFVVSGSDSRAGPALETLRELGARIHVGHDARFVEGVDRVVFSPAVPNNNQELRAARRSGIRVQSRAEVLAEFTNMRTSVCVAGSHGKTTTAAMLAFVLTRAGLHPGYVIGGLAPALDRKNARTGGDLFVVEACEAFGALAYWTPAHCIVTNIDDEHVEHYNDLNGLQNAFSDMIGRVRPDGATVVCGDDPGLMAVCKNAGREVVTYGIGVANVVRAEIDNRAAGGSRFTVYRDGASMGTVMLSLPGRHNVCNAVGVIAMAEKLGVPFAIAAKALGDFTNVDRRWQFVGKADGVCIFDDYAHHPTEIEAVLAVARRTLPPGGKLVLAFEPQLHSRVRRLVGRFAKALSAADLVLLAPVDAAGESVTTANGDELLTRALKASDAVFLRSATPKDIAAAALEHLKSGDLFVTMGPGRIANVADLVLRGLQKRMEVPAPTMALEFMSVSRGTDVPPLASHELIERFFANAQALPEARAVSCGTDTLSYADLAERARELANRLSQAGVGPERVAAVCLKAPVDRVVAFLGTLMVGGIYMPIDLSLPRERIDFMVRDSGATVMITTDAATVQQGSTAKVVRSASGLAPTSKIELDRSSRGALAAYIIYTSGTTGAPKGVVVEYGALCNFARAAAGAFGVVATDRISQVSAFGFDVAIGEMAMSLYAGACLVCPSEPSARTGVLLGNFVRDEVITHLSLTPSALSTLPHWDYPALTHVIVAGEVCPPDLADRWSLDKRFFNAYGPTEATILSTIGQHRPGQPVTIGRAMENTSAYILDDNRKPVRRGITGELWLAGAGLAREYLHRPELTAERFPVLTTLEDGPRRVYRTGDLATMLPDGQIRFLGRTDDQIKLRGFRIELGEVEVALRKHPSVQDAAVDVRKDGSRFDQLVAYLVCPGGCVPSREEIASFLSRWLPDYMIPSVVVGIAHIPLSPTGKRNRSGLPEPPRPRTRPQKDVPPKTPATPIEVELVEIVRRELAIEGEFGIRDSLVAMGVNSLQMVHLFAAVETHFGVELTSEAISNADTIELLALHIEKARPQRSPPTHINQHLLKSLAHKQLGFLSAWTGSRRRSDSLIFTRNSGGSAPALFWCFQGNQEHEQLAAHMESDRPIHGMRSGYLLFEYTPENIHSLASLYADEMMSMQPEGSFRMGGNCQGGTIVREIALLLRDRGREVALLCLMEQGRFLPFDGSVVLIFGAQSHLNPYLTIQDPDRIFKAAYGTKYCTDIISGGHGEYFRSPNIEVLARILGTHLKPFDKDL